MACFVTEFLADCGGGGRGMEPSGPAAHDNDVPRNPLESVYGWASAPKSNGNFGNPRERALIDEVTASLGGAGGAARLEARP